MTARPDDSAPDFDCLVFIGRFQPPHLGHLAVIREALRQARQVIVLVGSAWQARSLRNPWRYEERLRMLRSAFEEEENARLKVVPLLDALYNNDVWVRDVQRKVRDIASPADARLPRIGLIGASRGQSSYYLALFPQWESVSVPLVEGISASRIRERLFRSAGSAEDYLSTHAAHDLPPAWWRGSAPSSRRRPTTSLPRSSTCSISIDRPGPRRPTRPSSSPSMPWWYSPVMCCWSSGPPRRARGSMPCPAASSAPMNG